MLFNNGVEDERFSFSRLDFVLSPLVLLTCSDEVDEDEDEEEDDDDDDEDEDDDEELVGGVFISKYGFKKGGIQTPEGGAAAAAAAANEIDGI